MAIELGNFITVAIFLIGLVLSHLRTTSKIAGDGRVLKVQMDAMEKKLDGLGSVLVTLADFKGEFRVMNERSLAEGKRIDALQVLVMNAKLGAGN